MTALAARIERFALSAPFSIARGSKTEAVVVLVELTRDGVTGRGECVPYARYGETPEGVLALVESLAPALAQGLDRRALQAILPPGAARNALDCAFWDLDAKLAGTTVADLAGVTVPPRVETAFTIGLGKPQAMAQAAARAAHLPLLKVKLGGAGDEARIAAVRQAAPHSRLVVDANEAWSGDLLVPLLSACAACGVELVEQPLPAGADAALADIAHPVPICADESVHAGLAGLSGRYDAINLKLDKTGGLTQALALADGARAAGLDIMVGCMVGTSLAMAPALLLAAHARWVDLDGPLWLVADRPGGLGFADGRITPPEPGFWG